MERHLPGILAICLVLSSITTIFIAGERAAGVEMVENQYPETVYWSREKGVFTFHYGIVSREDYEHLEILVYSLEATPWDPELEEKMVTVENLAAEVPQIGTLRKMVLGLGRESSLTQIEINEDGFSGILYLLDFSSILDAFDPRGVRCFPQGARSGILVSTGAKLAFGYLYDDSGTFISSYWGTRDFYLDRELTLSDLYVRRNDQASSYTSTRLTEQPEGIRLLDAPPGRLVFAEVERDDRIEIGFSLNAAWLTGSPRVIQLVLVSGDSERVLSEANMIG